MTTNDRPDTLAADYLARLRVAALTLDASARDELVQGIAEHLEDAKARAGDTWSEARLLSVLDRLGTPEEIVAAAVTAPEPIPEPVPEPVPEPEPVLHAGAGEPPWGAPPPPRTGPQAHTLGAQQPAYAAAPAPWPAATSPTTTAPVSTQLELAAVLLIGLGFIVPGFGTIAGLVCVWLSKLWTTAEKVVASVLVVGPSIVAVLSLPLVFLSAPRLDGFWPFGMGDGGVAAPAWLALFVVGAIGFVLPILVAVWLWVVAKKRALGQV